MYLKHTKCQFEIFFVVKVDASQSPYDRCNFDADYCDWHQLQDDDFDWSRRSGPSSPNDFASGPLRDHTTNGETGLLNIQRVLII